MTTQTERERAYRVSCFPITEELRVGLIDEKTATSRMREAFIEIFGASDATRRRISEIEAALARPSEEGRDWDRRRASLERELVALRKGGGFV